MQTAYDILGVGEDADDDTIKQAYLRQVRLNPPDHAPEAFARVREAFEMIKDSRARADYALKPEPMPDLADVLSGYLRPGTPRRPSLRQWLNALAEINKGS